jgi:hypothetical protein
MTGKPMRFASASASEASFRTPLPASSGMPKRSAFFRAVTLSPHARIASGGGPMNTTPQAPQRRANSAFSERKPYPGWIASAAVISAALMMAGTFR